MLIDTPAVTDVLCGKDKTYAKHTGNIIYRGLIHAAAGAYAATPNKQEKMRVTLDIVNKMMHEHNSRFLKSANDGGGGGGAWKEISVTAARDKTSHALRFCAAHHGAAAAKRNAKPTRCSSSRAKTQPGAAAAKKYATPTRCSSSRQAKTQHRRTVSSETSVAMIRRRTIQSFPRHGSKKYYYAPEAVTSSTVVVVLNTATLSSAVKPLGVRSMNGEDLEAILREPLCWEDMDALDDGDGFFL